MKTIDEIKQQAEAVKNATQVGENTAERVGGALAGLAEIAKAQGDEISHANLHVYTDSYELNKYIKELYFDSDVDLSDVKKVRIVKSSSHNIFAIQFIDSKGVYIHNFSSPTPSNSILKLRDTGLSETKGYGYILIDWNLFNVDHPDSEHEILVNCNIRNMQNLDFSPSIKESISIVANLGEAEDKVMSQKAVTDEFNNIHNIVNKQVYTDNTELNKYIKELYFDSDVDLSDVKKVRIVKSSSHNIFAIQFIDSKGVYIHNFSSPTPSNSILKLRDTGLSETKGYGYILIDWNLFNVDHPDSEHEILVNCNIRNMQNLDFSPSIKESISIKSNQISANSYLPDYVLGIDSGTFQGREYFTCIYPEAIVDKYGNFKLNGEKKLIIQNLKEPQSSYPNVKEINVDVELTLDGEIVKSSKIKYIKANRNNAKNKKILLLSIGDSITEQNPSFNNSDEGGSWSNFIKQFALKDNEDIGDISLSLLGTRNKYTRNVDYNSKKIPCKNFSEGRSGWATYGYLNWSKWVRLDGKAYESDFAFIGAEAMYYALGLATKTPFDSSENGRDYVEFINTQEVLNEIVSTPLGRFKPNSNEKLYKALKNYKDFATLNPSDYNETESDKAVIKYLEDSMDSPDNPFYSKTKARAYTGNHIWTYSNAFSIEEYINRYRTLDSLGNRLEGSPGQNVEGKDGITYKIGTSINNVNDVDVSIPTHVIVSLGTNDFLISNEKIAELIYELLNVCKDAGIKNVGYFLPRRPGVLNPNIWLNYGTQRKISDFICEKEKCIHKKVGGLNKNGISYIPAYFTASPISSGYQDRIAFDLDDIVEQNKIVSGSDSVHPSAFWHRSVGYQCLAWIYWSLQA